MRLVSIYWEGMLEKSWPEISKGLGKELEVFSASDVPDSVKASRVGTHLEKARFSLPIRFRYGFHILTFPDIEIMGSYLESLTLGSKHHILYSMTVFL